MATMNNTNNTNNIAEGKQQLELQKKLELQKIQTKLSERFTNSIVTSYTDLTGVQITEQQRGLIMSYFIGIDNMLKNSKYGYTWAQVKMNDVKDKLVHYARLGLDWNIENTLSAMAFYDKKTGMIDIAFVKGKEAYKHLSRSFGIDPPEDYAYEPVHQTDVFEPIKLATGDTYNFKITNPFDRGPIIGFFGYLKYKDETKNRVFMMSKKELLKYKPGNAAEEFWGKWEEKMLDKTFAKQFFKLVELDPQKIQDFKDSFTALEADELTLTQLQGNEEKNLLANQGDVIDIPNVDAIEVQAEEVPFTEKVKVEVIETVEAEIVEDVKPDKKQKVKAAKSIEDILPPDF